MVYHDCELETDLLESLDIDHPVYKSSLSILLVSYHDGNNKRSILRRLSIEEVHRS